MTVLAIDQISKSYAGAPALSGLSFEVGENEIFGLIGPDGAGKTSLIRILVTLILPDSGRVTLFGQNILSDHLSVRQHIGYMPGRFSLYTDLTVAENLQFFATVYGVSIEDNYHIIRDIYTLLEPFSNRRAGNLSGGMKQKLALCCALIHHPRLLILDEPTTGVDPVSRKEFWEILDRLRDKGMTIVVSTPYMDEAGRCDRIALMQEGNILSIDSPDGITRRYPYRLYDLHAIEVRKALPFVREREYISSCYSFGETLHITFTNDDPAPEELLHDLSAAGITGTTISQTSPQIEDCFIQLMTQHHGENQHH